MDFIDTLRELATRIPKQVEHIRTEEATKSALVMPFIQALGYNVFDPAEVTPEFVADFGTKKGEKVDYVILRDGKPIMMFECKSVNADLDKLGPAQLYRYFSVSSARIGIFTNGIVYKVFADLEEPNKMDSKPFLELNMLGLEDPVVPEIKKLTKSLFDVNQVLLSASEFKYIRALKRLIAAELVEPSDEFVKLFARKVYPGVVTPTVRDQFIQYAKRAFSQFINEQINARLKSALVPDTPGVPDNVEPGPAPATSATNVANLPLASDSSADRQITTTPEELEAYYIIKAILRDGIDAARIVLRDALSYCAILLDDKNNKPICRLYFKVTTKYVVILDKDRHEEKIILERLDDLYKLADKLKQSAASYDKPRPIE